MEGEPLASIRQPQKMTQEPLRDSSHPETRSGKDTFAQPLMHSRVQSLPNRTYSIQYQVSHTFVYENMSQEEFYEAQQMLVKQKIPSSVDFRVCPV